MWGGPGGELPYRNGEIMLETIPSLYPVRPLIVGANAQRRALLLSVLNAFGVSQCHTATNSLEAVHLLRTVKPDVLITALELCPDDGISLTRFLRHDEQSPNPYQPVILVLEPAEQQRIGEARDAGVNAVLAAPITAQSLRTHLVELIENPRPFIRVAGYFGPDRRFRPHKDTATTGNFRPRRTYAA